MSLFYNLKIISSHVSVDSTMVRAFAQGCDGSSDRSFMGWTH